MIKPSSSNSAAVSKLKKPTQLVLEIAVTTYKSIATQRGDTGQTDLLYGGRVSKSDIAVDAFGTGDEAIATLGIAYATAADPRTRELVRSMQNRLYALNAHLATSSKHDEKLETHFRVPDVLQISELDQALKELEDEVKLPPHFIIPGSSLAAANIDLARTIVRRMERTIVLMHEENLVNAGIVSYVNRMSDVLFMIARFEEREQGHDTFESLRRGKKS